jgi:putative chitinase
MLDVKKLQQRLGVSVDGHPGPVTLAALFGKMGAPATMQAALGAGGYAGLGAYHITDTALRLAHWLAQCAHECDGFRALTEYASGAAYEGRADLGNTQPGDGPRFRGRGLIQLTGRANYAAAGLALGVDLLSAPEVAAQPAMAVRTACWFWQTHGLNPLADADNVEAITRRINGGVNGIADRKARLAVAKGLLL